MTKRTATFSELLEARERAKEELRYLLRQDIDTERHENAIAACSDAYDRALTNIINRPSRTFEEYNQKALIFVGVMHRHLNEDLDLQSPSWEPLPADETVAAFSNAMHKEARTFESSLRFEPASIGGGIVTQLAGQIERLWEIYNEVEHKYPEDRDEIISKYTRRQTLENLTLLSRALQFQLLIAAPLNITEAAIQVAMARSALKTAAEIGEGRIFEADAIEVPSAVAYDALNRASLFLARSQGVDLLSTIGKTNYVSAEDCDVAAIAEALNLPQAETSAPSKGEGRVKAKPAPLKVAA